MNSADGDKKEAKEVTTSHTVCKQDAATQEEEEEEQQQQEEEEEEEEQGWDLVLRALYEQAQNSSHVQGSSRAVLFQDEQPPNNIKLGEQYWEMNRADGDRDGRVSHQKTCVFFI